MKKLLLTVLAAKTTFTLVGGVDAFGDNSCDNLRNVFLRNGIMEKIKEDADGFPEFRKLLTLVDEMQVLDEKITALNGEILAYRNDLTRRNFWNKTFGEGKAVRERLRNAFKAREELVYMQSNDKRAMRETSDLLATKVFDWLTTNDEAVRARFLLYEELDKAIGIGNNILYLSKVYRDKLLQAGAKESFSFFNNPEAIRLNELFQNPRTNPFLGITQDYLRAIENSFNSFSEAGIDTQQLQVLLEKVRAIVSISNSAMMGNADGYRTLLVNLDDIHETLRKKVEPLVSEINAIMVPKRNELWNYLDELTCGIRDMCNK